MEPLSILNYLRRLIAMRQPCYHHQKPYRARLIGAFLFANICVFMFVRFVFTANPTAVPSFFGGPYLGHVEKVILFWTPWFGDANWTSVYEYNKGPVIDLNDGTHRSCLLTADRRLIGEADAVVFHGRDLNKNDEPTIARRSDQPWIFFSLEPPYMTFTDGSWSWLVNVSTFNWTISYSSKATVRFPYGRLIPKPPQSTSELNKTADKIAEFVENFSKRKKDAVWIVSHCDTLSKREKLVERLEELGITVDTFGKCSGITPPSWDPQDGKFFSKYRFYLSLENSICDDYVSEKLFRGLHLSENFGLIPLAYHGDVDYNQLGVPSRSFIDIRKFLPNNLTGLAKYLKKTLPDDLLQLADFYSWQFSHNVDPFPFAFKWRNLCESVWNQYSKPENVINDVRETFGRCEEMPPDDAFLSA